MSRALPRLLWASKSIGLFLPGQSGVPFIASSNWPLLAEGGAEIDADVGVIGADFQGFMVRGDGIVKAIHPQKKNPPPRLGQVAVAEVGIGERILFGDGGGMEEDGFVILPEGDLMFG